MTKQEWKREAERYEAEVRQAYDQGDESLGELWELKARACRANASDAMDELNQVWPGKNKEGDIG